MEEGRKYRAHWVWPFLVAVLLIALGVSMAMGIRAQVKLEKSEAVAMEYRGIDYDLRAYLTKGYIPGTVIEDDLGGVRTREMKADQLFTETFGHEP